MKYEVSNHWGGLIWKLPYGLLSNGFDLCFAKVHIMLELGSIHRTSISLMLGAGWPVGGRIQLILI